jgi:hypothetical protein
VISASEQGRALIACFVLATATLARPVAAADDYGDNDTRTAARALAAQGSVAFEQRDFERALTLFQRASAIIPAPTITLMEARTLVELGRLVEALERYEATERMVALDPTNAAFNEAATAAQRETEALLQRIPTLRVRVDGALPGEVLEIDVDGKKVQAALAAVDRPSDPGPHRIGARTSTGRTATRELTLAERAHEDVVLVLGPLPAPAPVAKSASNTGRTLGFGLLISGAAFTLAGTVTGVMALDKKSDLDAACHPGCPENMAGTLDAYRRERTASYVTFALGGAALAAGTYLVLSHPTRGLAFYVTPNTVAMAGHFR